MLKMQAPQEVLSATKVNTPFIAEIKIFHFFNTLYVHLLFLRTDHSSEAIYFS